MNFIGKLAYRNITRNSKRTVINVLSSMIALSVIIFFEGFMTGMFDLMRKNAVETTIGDLQIHPAEYRDDSSLYLNIKDSNKISTSLDKEKFYTSEHFLSGALLAANNDSSGVFITGLNPEDEKKVTLLHKNVFKGKWLSELGKNEVVIGKDLAEKSFKSQSVIK